MSRAGSSGPPPGTGGSPAALPPPFDDPRYAEGVGLFQAEEFFEAHESLELAWRAMSAGPDKLFLQGLIQLAVSLEHWRRANPRGARGQWEKARAKLDGLPAVYGGLALGELLAGFREWYAPYDLDAAVALQAEGRWVHPVDPRPRPLPRWMEP